VSFYRRKDDCLGVFRFLCRDGDGDESFPPLRVSGFSVYLEVKGELKDGKGNGTYTISFSVPAWPSGFSGEWTATRIEGRNITE